MTTDNEGTVEYQVGLQDHHRERAGDLYFEAFRQKLGPFLGPGGPRLLADTFNVDRAITASLGGELIGLAGYTQKNRAFVGLDWHEIRAAYGLIGGSWRAIGLSLFDRKVRPGELLMDGLVVAAPARGRGVGAELLRRIATLARSQRFYQIRLDVVDSNPGARRLYEREGFTAEKTESLELFRRWFGFGASTTMIKQLGDPGA